jgi:hypothetical protein
LENEQCHINLPHHIFNDIFETSILNEEQKQKFDLLNFTNKKVHTHQGHPSSRKTFFVKYLPTHQLQLLSGDKSLLELVNFIIIIPHPNGEWYC